MNTKCTLHFLPNKRFPRIPAFPRPEVVSLLITLVAFAWLFSVVSFQMRPHMDPQTTWIRATKAAFTQAVVNVHYSYQNPSIQLLKIKPRSGDMVYTCVIISTDGDISLRNVSIDNSSGIPNSQ